MPGSPVGALILFMFGAMYGPVRIFILWTPGIGLSVFNFWKRGAAPGGSGRMILKTIKD
jgi:hypothetical protein